REARLRPQAVPRRMHVRKIVFGGKRRSAKRWTHLGQRPFRNAHQGPVRAAPGGRLPASCQNRLHLAACLRTIVAILSAGSLDFPGNAASAHGGGSIRAEEALLLRPRSKRA